MLEEIWFGQAFQGSAFIMLALNLLSVELWFHIVFSIISTPCLFFTSSFQTTFGLGLLASCGRCGRPTSPFIILGFGDDTTDRTRSTGAR